MFAIGDVSFVFCAQYLALRENADRTLFRDRLGNLSKHPAYALVCLLHKLPYRFAVELILLTWYDLREIVVLESEMRIRMYCSGSFARFLLGPYFSTVCVCRRKGPKSLVFNNRFSLLVLVGIWIGAEVLLGFAQI